MAFKARLLINVPLLALLTILADIAHSQTVRTLTIPAGNARRSHYSQNLSQVRVNWRDGVLFMNPTKRRTAALQSTCLKRFSDVEIQDTNCLPELLRCVGEPTVVKG
jgi:hypothetical protein